jgi:predicted RNA methylase
MKQPSEIEIRRQGEQHQLDRFVDEKQRNRLGQFATPPSLALEIMQAVWKKWRRRKEPVRFLEPALGTGAFYSALRKVFPSGSIEKAEGIEIDAALAKSASSLWNETGLNVTEGDFTKQEPVPGEKRFNLLVTNPPYVRHHHMARKDKERLGKKLLRVLGLKVSGLSGLYLYFFLLADNWLDKNAICAWLIPSEFMDVNYGIAVKRYLSKNVTLLQVHRFCPMDVQFDDALVSSAVVIFEKAVPSASHRVCFSFGGSLLKPHVVRDMPLNAVRFTDKWTRYPIAGCRTNEDRHSCNLGDLFSIKRGLATGANNFFIMEKDEAIRLGIEPEFLKPILPSPRKLLKVIIDRDDQGFPCLEQQLCLINCNLPERTIKEKHSGLWRYLESGKKIGLNNGYLTSRRLPWYSQEKREPAPFLCTYMGRTNNGRDPVRFLWNKSDAVAHNVYLMLYPKAHLKAFLESKDNLYGAVFESLSSIDTHQIVQGGRVYGGGLYKMEPKELSAINAEPVARVLQNEGFATQKVFQI